MNARNTDIDTLHDIRNIMERSSRFISLSGWSGVFAGLSALSGAYRAYIKIDAYNKSNSSCASCLRNDLMTIAVIIFVCAFFTALLFTYAKSKKENVPIWGSAARRLLWNTVIPMIAAAFVLWKMIDLEYYELLVPTSLIFYGLALVNGSKYTMGEVRYLGYAELVTGIVALFVTWAYLYLWAFGFGVLHIFYGIAMWWKYDRTANS